MDFIRITALTDIGNNIAYSSLIPVVDMAGTPTTKKANLQIVANLVLSGAGGSYFAPAARAILAQSVTNAAQPNITSVGTLSSLTVSGNIGVGNVNATGTLYTSGVSATGFTSLTTLNVSTSANLGAVSNVTITGGTNGQVLTTNGTGGLSWTTVSGGSSYGNSNVAAYLPTYTGNIGANTIRSTTASGSNLQIVANNAVFTFGQGGALYWPGGTNVWAIEPNIDDEFEIKSTSNVVISTDISNANSHFTFDTDGIFTAPSNVNLLGSRLNVGPDAVSAGNLLNPTLVIANTGADYIQAAIINNDGAGSSDWSADGAGGGDDEAWTDMGFAGFSFNDANYTITEPGDGYLFVQGYANGLGGNMVLATGDHSNTSDIIFATGGFLSNNEFARIDHANSLFHLTRPGSGIKFQDGTEQTTAYTGGSVGLPLANGNSNFNISTIDGSPTITANDAATWTFGTDGFLTLPGGNVILGSVFGGNALFSNNVPVGVVSQGANAGTVVQWSDDVANTSQLSAIFVNGPIGNVGDIQVITGNVVTPNVWTFGADGVLTLANGISTIHSVANSSLDPLIPNVSTMILTPDPNYMSQALVLDPTAPGHIHLRGPSGTGNIDEPAANLFLGGESSSFEVGASYGGAPNVYVHSNGNTWTFDNTGNLTLPTNSFIQGTANLEIYAGNGDAQGGYLGFVAGTGNIGGDLGIYGGFGTVTDGGNVLISGGITTTAGKGGDAEIKGGDGNIGGNVLIRGGYGNTVGNVEITGENVVVKAWTFDNTGNLTFGIGNEPVIKWSTAPVSNTSEGYAGQAAYDSGGNLFVCVATNTWAKFSGTTSW